MYKIIETFKMAALNGGPFPGLGPVPRPRVHTMQLASVVGPGSTAVSTDTVERKQTQRGTSGSLTGSQDVLPAQLGVTYRVTPKQLLWQRLILKASQGPAETSVRMHGTLGHSLPADFQAVGF